MKQAWDKTGMLEQQRHRVPLRRRWSPELKKLTSSNPCWIAEQGTKKVARTSQRVSKKDSADVAKLLQLQTENFVRTLELQSLRQSVNVLLSARDQAEEKLRSFHAEVRGLERDSNAAVETALNYELSESDWLDIIER
jgi:hypothetical protein